MIPVGSLGKLPTCSKCNGLHRDLWCPNSKPEPKTQEPILLDRMAKVLDEMLRFYYGATGSRNGKHSAERAEKLLAEYDQRKEKP